MFVAAFAAAVALHSGPSLAKDAKKVQVKTVKQAPAATAQAPLGKAVAQEVAGEIRGHVSMCAIVNAVRATPCASRVLAEKLIPELLPLEIKNVAFRKTATADVAKLAKDGRTEPAPPELAGLPEDMEVSLKIEALEVSPSAGLETIGVSGMMDVEVKTPNNKAIKSTSARIKFTGLARVVYGPSDLAGCKKFAGGEALRMYVGLVLATINIEKLSTERAWWAKLFPGDKTARWILNYVLGLVSHAVQGDAYRQLAELGVDTKKLPNAPLGFPICLGKKSGCGSRGPARPPPGFLAATVSVGKLGSIDFAQAGAAKPFLELSSTEFLCHAFNAVAGLQQCVKPFADAVLGTVLPITLSVPKEVVSVATRGDSKAGSFALAVKSIAVEAAEKPGPHIDLSATLKAALTDPTDPAHAPFEASGKAQVSLGAVCSGDGFFLWKRLAIESIESSAAIPPWLAEGLGRSAVNSHLPAIELCVERETVPGLEHSIDICGLGKKLLERRSTGVAADAALAALLPLEIQPRRFLKTGARPVLAKMFDGITVSLTEAVLATGKGPDSLTVSIAASKSGQAEKLQTKATIALAMEAHCGPKRGLVRFTPTVTDLSVTKIPGWLLQTTLLELINDKMSHAPPLICVQGACKQQPKQVAALPVVLPTLDTKVACSLEGGR